LDGRFRLGFVLFALESGCPFFALALVTHALNGRTRTVGVPHFVPAFAAHALDERLRVANFTRSRPSNWNALLVDLALSRPLD
jgi:hypothetical protein